MVLQSFESMIKQCHPRELSDSTVSIDGRRSKFQPVLHTSATMGKAIQLQACCRRWDPYISYHTSYTRICVICRYPKFSFSGARGNTLCGRSSSGFIGRTTRSNGMNLSRTPNWEMGRHGCRVQTMRGRQVKCPSFEIKRIHAPRSSKPLGLHVGWDVPR